jgi:secondary thiamine-phosphate synthase enzyme
MMHKLHVNTEQKTQIIDITMQVQSAVNATQISEGVCTIYVPHTTASVCIQENADPNVHIDLLDALERLVPKDIPYLHETERKNAPSHIKAALLGTSQTVLIAGGQIQLGTYQSIYFFEFDGPRSARQVWLRITGVSN